MPESRIRESVTERLYYIDSHMHEFDAAVLSCTPSDGRYAVILDKTAFFPEGGGQPADTGYIGDARISDVQTVGENIIHYADRPVEEKAVLHCSLDWEQRFRRMQNHTGEHIICGTAHRLYGYENVGFHLGEHDVTIDLSGELTEEQIRDLEMRANRVAAQNVAVTAEFPSAEELENMEYRSKLELTEDVRIVTIEGVDRCACCAPHVSRTGEIGMIKLLDYMRYKGGMRLHMQCGFDAVEDFNVKYDNVLRISAMLSAPQERTAEYVSRTLGEMQTLRMAIHELNRQLVELKLASVQPSEGNICFFEPTFGMDELRAMVNGALPSCGGICAAFSGSDDNGYNYVMASRSVPLRSEAKSINAALNGKGGGSDGMIQGSVRASRAEIDKYFS